jgi:hypothetical protein
VGGDPISVLLAELGRDGKPDVITAKFNPANFSVLLDQMFN